MAHKQLERGSNDPSAVPMALALVFAAVVAITSASVCSDLKLAADMGRVH